MAETTLNSYQPRKYDIVILGASGFTGKYVLREALKFLNTPNSPLKTLAIAGRDPEKLASALSWAQASINSKNNQIITTQSVPIITADTTSNSSLINAASQARVLLSCVGPFRIHGDPVVAACLEAGCDYLDICGEPEFMERCEVKYNEVAVEKGVLVISACGFDSIPAELGLMFNSRQWASPKEVLNSVEAYFCIESSKRLVGNFGTYESAILGFANADSFIQWRKTCIKRPRPQIPGPPPQKGPTLEHQKGLGLWAVKLPSADAGVVRRTLSLLTKNPSGLPGVNESPDHTTRREKFWSSVKPAHFGVKLANKSLLGTLRHIFIGILIGLFGTSEWGRSLLLKFPSLFTLGWFNRKGPSEDEVNSASFKMWFVGQGFSDRSSNTFLEKRVPDTEIITRIMGPESGYIATPIMLVQCALILLSQRENFPKGGVFPPGIMFGPTDLQERLQQNGISFDFISRRSLSS